MIDAGPLQNTKHSAFTTETVDMPSSTLHMILQLVQAMSVVMVLAYLLIRTTFFNEVLQRRLTPQNLLILSVIFGAFSIYGTLAGFDFLGAGINIRDLGPSLAGLVGGPIAGLGAGLIGGTHRLLLGGPTCTSCALSTVLAGLLAGMIHMILKGKVVSIRLAATWGFIMESIHMGMAMLLITPLDTPVIPWETRLEIIKGASLPMMTANALGMAIFVFIVKNQIREREVEGAKKMMEGELRVARDIQMGIVPKIFPAYPDRPEFDLHAFLEPAKEVGGDLYDFYELDEKHLFFVLGDVSGKGVPASLFMAITVALFKACAKPGRGPAEILNMVNAQLARDNEACMFVTLICGILDTDTGEIRYANAGHNPPLHIRKDSSVRYIDAPPSLVAGAMPEMQYMEHTLKLAPGETVLIYTDGITEAMNTAEELYSEERLKQDLEQLVDNPGQAIISGIADKVRIFAGQAPQSDDMTMLCLTWTGEK